MKRFAAIVAVSVLAAPCWLTAQQSDGLSIVLDRYMSPAAGTHDLLTLQRALSALEDRFLPLKFGDERRRLPLLAGIGYRAGKLLLLDVPQDHMLLVVGHEVFGHGARLRELGVGRIGYSFDGPVPFAHGGAVTSFSGNVPDTPLAFLTIQMAGIEAQNVMADEMAERSLGRGRIHYREAWLYFENRVVAMNYMLSATEHSKDGHDVTDFWKTFKDACETPACTPVTLKQIKTGSRMTLADPMLYYALYGFTSSYIGGGRIDSRVPMLPIGGGLRVLPSAGFQLTPYGSEHVFRAVVVQRGTRTLAFTLRAGDTGASTPWGIDARLSDVPVFRKLDVRANVSLWKQPPALGSHTSEPLRTGAAATATVLLPLQKLLRASRLQAVVTAGYKSDGYLPGAQLSHGLILRAGVQTEH